MTAPGILVTATHVLDPVQPSASDGVLHEDVMLLAQFVSTENAPSKTSGTKWGGPLVITQAVTNADHDLALLRFVVPLVGGKPPGSGLLP